MKIVSVTMVKNEENILESFVRHAMTFSDNVIVYNHGSTDGTLAILEALAQEYGERFLIYPEIENTVMTINQEVFNHMIHYAFAEMNADMVLPLDSDEFPVMVPKSNLRSYLENLDRKCCYRVHFMPFAISEKWDKDTFAPLLFDKRKKLSIHTDPKMFLLREPYEKYGLQVSLGNHTIHSTTTEQEAPVKDLFPEMFYAHLAFRNKEHLESKLVIRWLALMMRSDVTKGVAFQYRDGFEKILAGGQLSKEEMDWFSLNNMHAGIDKTESLEQIQSEIEEIDAKELFDDLQLKYTELVQDKSNYVLLMEFANQVIGQYKEQKKKLQDLKNEQNMLEGQIKSQQEHIKQLEKALAQTEALLAQAEAGRLTAVRDLQNIRDSKAWKLIQTYRKLIGKHDPTQD